MAFSRSYFAISVDRRAQLAAGAVEQRLRLVEVAALQQQHGELDAAAGARERVAHLLAAARR